MKFKNPIFNKIIVAGYVLSYILTLGLTAQHGNFYLLTLCLLPVCVMFCFFKISKPITFFVFNLIFWIASLSDEFFGWMPEDITVIEDFALSHSYAESDLFFKAYFLCVFFIIFYLPTALFASLINLGIKNSKTWISASSLAVLFIICLAQLVYVYAFMKRGFDIVLVSTIFISVQIILAGAVISPKFRDRLFIFDHPKRQEQI
jgi:hypothetical protein